MRPGFLTRYCGKNCPYLSCPRSVITPTPPGTWQSSHTGVATVDANGLLTGLTHGTVTITFTVNGIVQSATAAIRIRGGDAVVIIQ